MLHKQCMNKTNASDRSVRFTDIKIDVVKENVRQVINKIENKEPII